MSGHIYSVLFLCHDNAGLSILAEAAMNHLGRGRFRATSAGPSPGGTVHPLATAALESKGIASAGLRSKSWDELADLKGGAFDFIFYLRDSEAGRPSIPWRGQTFTASWEVEDPARISGTLEQQRSSFAAALELLSFRIELFMSQPGAWLGLMSLRSGLAGIRKHVSPPALLAVTAPGALQPTSRAMTEKTYNVLFLCTGNSARSILAEVVMNKLGRGRFQAFSAGSHPTGQVNPFAIDALQRMKFPTEGLRSKSWTEFSAPGAPQLDFAFTVCDKAAGESCPVWPGQPMTAHWGVEDPAAATGSDDEKRKVFRSTLITLSRRIELFLSLPIASLDRMSLQREIVRIGKT